MSRPDSIDALHALVERVDLGETPESMRQGFAEIMQGQPAGQAAEIGGIKGLYVGMGPLRALWFHGGGYVFGSPSTHTLAAQKIAEAMGGRIFLPDYSLAPEQTWPAPLEDAKAVKDAIDHPIAVIGDSAGGHLALNLALAHPDRISALALFSPNTDRTGLSETREANTPTDRMNSHEKDQELFRMSCPEREVDDPVVSPLLADLLSLPPTWLAVGGAEVLLDDTLLLARALGRADKTVRLRVLSGRSHMFWQWPDLFNDAREALEDAAAFLLGNSERKVAAAPSIP